MEEQWSLHYDVLRRDFMVKRKTGIPLTSTDISDFSNRSKDLEKALKVIQDSPMEYEMYIHITFLACVVDG
jgi:hypothetical protein